MVNLLYVWKIKFDSDFGLYVIISQHEIIEMIWIFKEPLQQESTTTVTQKHMLVQEDECNG